MSQEIKSQIQKLNEEFGLIQNEDGTVTTNSLKVAEYYGKGHNDVMKKIRKFIELIPELAEGNFTHGIYLDGNNQERPMFIMDRQGFSMLVNKFTGDEATLFTYKYTKAFEQMIELIGQLKEEVKELDTACQIEDKTKREYQRKKTIYGWRNLKNTLMACDYKNLEDTVTDIINFHVNVLKKNDRVYGYSNLDKTSYKQAVRDRVYNILDCVYNNTKDGVLRTVAGEVKETLIKDKIATINRSNGHVISGLQKELESLKPTPLEDMVCINYHAFSYDNSAIDKDGHWKPAYRTWIQNFPMEDIPSINYWLDRGVDFNKPVKIIIKCVNKKEFDTTNLVKAIQDVLFNKERGKYRADDNFIRAGEIETIDFCDDYSDGKMYIDLENIDNCNIIDTNMDANMNEQLHNQEFAEFVSNLFGDF